MLCSGRRNQTHCRCALSVIGHAGASAVRALLTHKFVAQSAPEEKDTCLHHNLRRTAHLRLAPDPDK